MMFLAILFTEKLPLDAALQGIPLVCSGEFENRSITRWMKNTMSTDPEAEDNTPPIEKEVSTTLKDIASSYLTPLLKHLTGYFISGENPSGYNSSLPEWIHLSKAAFNFCAPFDEDKRKLSFKKLIPLMVQPLTDKDSKGANFQYNILLSRALKLVEDEGTASLKSVMYRLCTSSHIYTGCELAILVMVYNVSSASSECGIESLISSISRHNTKNRPLTIGQLHHELMISQNGPHPLHSSTSKFLYDSLRTQFGGGPETWNFTRSASQGITTSQVISRHMNSAPKPKLQ